ncbi:4'-phosphopantetheinyl transferase family protein [Desulfosediminicola flagellatus]|uniref:4'-phosphopantetheinyl transferase family protein n=1 Tax=Desulfosediminicola flagellatus TaxID=2569541 RepID=UPI0010AD3A6C|nr:4'-phosphopantetheinyl transferase superfamily protein [Desulfosediminicola flagellatus]
MFVNIFPKTLLSLMKQTYPRHRFQAVMLPLISPKEYTARAKDVPHHRHLITPEELAKANSFSIPKRRKEWLTGRICAKAAALMYHNLISTNTEPDLFKISAENDDNGRPFLSGNLTEELQNADLSISHGADYGLALIADSICGTDIQAPKDTLTRVREKFCTQVEQELLQLQLPELNELQHLTLIWTAKEAAKKALSHKRMPGFLELILTTTEPHTTGWILTFLVSKKEHEAYPSTISVVTELYQTHAIALCLNHEVNHA